MKKLTALVLIAITVLLAAACGMLPGDKEDLQPGDTVVPPQPEGETVELTLYFANSEYVTTGNESLEKLLPE
ncbi:MAG TPA: hypothetical protein PK684_04790, partial [Bacillota bacterium]|nr:hypothetical protein [Bacillota bacterium]